MKLYVLLLSIFIVSVSGLTQTDKNWQFTATDKLWYLEYLPPTYDPTGVNKSPVIIFCHGNGEISWNSNWPNDLNFLRTAAVGSPPYLIHNNRFPSGLPFVVLSPQINGAGWNASKMMAFTAALPTLYPGIDSTRVYLTGLSGGGAAIYEMLQVSKSNADLFAALISMAGPPVTTGTGIYESSLPCWGFWNRDDNVVFWGTIETINYLNNQGICPTAKKTIFPAAFNPNLKHDCWTPLYERTDPNYDIYSWLLSYTNQRTFTSGCTSSITTIFSSTTGTGSTTTTTSSTTGGSTPTTTTTCGSVTTTSSSTTGIPTTLQLSKFSDPATDFCVVSSTDDVYKIVDSTNLSFRRNHLDGTWTQIGSSGQSLACTSSYAYVLLWGAIYRWDNAANNWFVTGPGNVNAQYLIGGGNTLYYYSNGDNTVQKLNATSNTWSTVGYFPPGTKFSASGDSLFALLPIANGTTGGLLQIYTNGVLSNTNIFDGVTVLSGRSRGYVILGSNRYIWGGNTPTFIGIGGPGAAFGVTKNVLYGVGDDGIGIYRNAEGTQTWWGVFNSATPITRIIPNGIRLYAVVSNGDLYTLYGDDI